MKRFKHDLRYLVSAGLLLTVIATAVTGLIADVWDINDFIYHKYAGYTLAIFASVHTGLVGHRLIDYARRRLSPRPISWRSAQPESASPSKSEIAPRGLLSRRGFVGLVLGGAGGFALGRSLQVQPALPYGSDIGMTYHEWSKPGLSDLLGAVANWGRQPPLYKEYPDTVQIALPEPGEFRGLYVEDAIQRRRSVRDYSGQPMTLAELARLLYYSGGINAERWGRHLRSAPSAGALYPIETYVVAHRVENLQPGLYHYAVRDRALNQLRTGDLRGAIVRHGVMQDFLGQANVVLIYTAIFQRLRWKYQARAYRYAMLEAGHLGQNVYLAATSMGMGACAVGAFMDDGLNGLVGVDGQEEAALYVLAVGKV